MLSKVTFTSAAEFVRRFSRPENLSRPWHHWLRVSPQAHPQGESFKHSHKNTQAAGNTHTHTHTDNPSKLPVSVCDGVCMQLRELNVWRERYRKSNCVAKGIAHDNDNNRSENVRCVGKPLQKQVRVRGWCCMTPRWLYSSQGGGEIYPGAIHTQV
jgi:hypothetical protein